MFNSLEVFIYTLPLHAFSPQSLVHSKLLQQKRVNVKIRLILMIKRLQKLYLSELYTTALVIFMILVLSKLIEILHPCDPRVY